MHVSRRLLALTLLAGCAQGPRLVQLDRDDGRVARRGTLLAGKQQGTWEFWHDNGQLEARGDYRDDLRTGSWQHWYENGTRRMAGEYDGNRQVGSWQFWHPTGARQCAGEYLDGREHGEWSFWYPDDTLQQRGCFRRGRRTLWWTTFRADGSPESAGCHLADTPVGRWQHWDADGRVTEFDHPIPDGVQLVREPWDDGSTRREGILQQGTPDGLWLTRHRGGALRLIGEMVDGRPQGPWRAFTGTGELLASGEVTAGVPSGSWSVRTPTGMRTVAAGTHPTPPWDRRWSDAAIVDDTPALAVVARWLAEITSPSAPPAPTPVVAPPPAEAPPPPPPLEAPTDAGAFTVRELEELEQYRRYYKNGWLPPGMPGHDYGGNTDTGRLGGGDDALARSLLGRKLPTTAFHDAAGKPFDLDSLRGKRVLLIVLRGFTTQVCVYCFAQTKELEPFVPQLRELDCEPVVLFPGSRSRLQAFAAMCAEESEAMPTSYTTLYDPDLALTTALGLSGNLARPSSLILDRDGIVRHAYVAESERNIADRPPATDLLRAVRNLPDPRR